MRKLVPGLIGLGLLLNAAEAVGARQSNLASATVYTVDYSTFPTSSALVDFFDSQGIFASGLKPEAVTVLEDGQPLPVDSLTELAIPLQLVVAVNQGEPLDARDPTGLSRFQRLAQVLAQWAQARAPDLPDDFSLVSQAGPVINHATATQFIEGLNSFQPDFRAATPNLQSLAIALDTVSAQTPRLGMKRAILFITPHMDNPDLAAVMDPLLQRAAASGIRVFIWFVDFDFTFNTTSAAVFNSLAIQTGGSMFYFSGAERFPDPEVYFSPLRRIYSMTYSSRLTTAGEHTLSLQANLPSGAVASNELKFTVDIQPPNPILITPSLQITRQAPADDPFNTEILLPTEEQIEIIVEFPDQHERPLTRTTLYIDGQIMDENTAEPFDVFTWDLSGYTLSGEHQVIVEAVDVIGLSRKSMAIPVTVTVIQAPRGPAALLARYRTPITIGAVLIAGISLIIILVSGRVRIPSLRAVRESRRAEADPLTQTIQTGTPTVATAAGTAKKRKPRASSKKAAAAAPTRVEAPASFIRLTPEGQPAPLAPIDLDHEELIFGTDPVQCNRILSDASISSVHARLRAMEDGGFLLQDNNSIAGTWVNYEPVEREGRRLSHRDMVHFGQLTFRFTLRTPPEVKKPTITILAIEE
ncbi:MAG: FHA domain-containing protein [Chloroflexi bacterium]|nr:FHA domain-containing protein [Chloroflexota bacterium]